MYCLQVCLPARHAGPTVWLPSHQCSHSSAVTQALMETEQQPAPASAPQSPFAAEASEPSNAPSQQAEPEDKPPPQAALPDVSAADRRAAVEKADALIKHGLEVFNRGQPEQVPHPLLLPASHSCQGIDT